MTALHRAAAVLHHAKTFEAKIAAITRLKRIGTRVLEH